MMMTAGHLAFLALPFLFRPIFMLGWRTFFVLCLMLAVASESASTLNLKQGTQFTSTLGYSPAASYPRCNEPAPGQMEDVYCWKEQSFEFSSPLATSVACNSVTYILNQRPKHVTNITTGIFTQLLTPIMSDPEYSSLYEQRDLQMLIAYDTKMGQCTTWGMERPDNTFHCEIYAEDVHLLYSPPETPLLRDMCATTPLLTVTEFGNAKHVPQTVLEGVTLYRDRVYISVGKIHAWTSVWSPQTVSDWQTLAGSRSRWECNRMPLGTTVSRTIIELQSHEVSTLRVPNTNRFYPFNYADLMEPVPRSAWLGRSIEGLTSPYYFPVPEDGEGPPFLGVYQPYLAMPTKVRSMDPKWKSCVGYVVGWKDPPIALSPADSPDESKITPVVGSAWDQSAYPKPSKGTAMPGSIPSQTPRVTARPAMTYPDEFALDTFSSNDADTDNSVSQAHEPNNSGRNKPSSDQPSNSSPDINDRINNDPNNNNRKPNDLDNQLYEYNSPKGYLQPNKPKPNGKTAKSSQVGPAKTAETTNGHDSTISLEFEAGYSADMLELGTNYPTPGMPPSGKIQEKKLKSASSLSGEMQKLVYSVSFGLWLCFLYL